MIVEYIDGLEDKMVDSELNKHRLIKSTIDGLCMGLSFSIVMTLASFGTLNPFEIYRMHKKSEFYSSFFEQDSTGRISKDGVYKLRSWLGKDSVLLNSQIWSHRKDVEILEKAVTNHFSSMAQDDTTEKYQKSQFENFKKEYK